MSQGLRRAALATVLLALSSCSEPDPGHSTLREPSSAARIDILGTQSKTYSQFDEDLIIRDFFQDRRDGFYLDVGCAWAERASTTYYLEKHLGWSGIGVDAVAEYAPGWAKKRRRAKFFNYLVSDHSDTEDTFYRTNWPSVSSAVKEMAEKFEGGYEEIAVPTITLNRLLEITGVSKIDFLSMDIEGFQMTALKGFDIQKYQPDLVCIEAYYEDRAKIKAWFEERGYRRIDRYLERDSINWYFSPMSGHDPGS
ncbi:MAG: FkbM family methyltransferase [Myxococcota bacterium]|nr:FkbM family methyltransferase [Myxococcota bacterium]